MIKLETLNKVSEERVFKTPRMEGLRVRYEDLNGNEAMTHTIIHSKDSVATIARKDGKIAFIIQFRSTTGQYYIELPAGLLEEGETEEMAAIRETREETGLLIKNVRIVVNGPAILDPSKSDENYGVAIADVYGKKDRCLDKMEKIYKEVIWLDEKYVFSRVMAHIEKGEPFYEDFQMSGHSLFALISYMLTIYFHQ